MMGVELDMGKAKSGISDFRSKLPELLFGHLGYTWSAALGVAALDFGFIGYLYGADALPKGVRVAAGLLGVAGCVGMVLVSVSSFAEQRRIMDGIAHLGRGREEEMQEELRKLWGAWVRRVGRQGRWFLRCIGLSLGGPVLVLSWPTLQWLIEKRYGI